MMQQNAQEAGKTSGGLSKLEHRQALYANVDACFSACKCKQTTKDTATGILQG